jgi:hypothetical protein
MKFRALAAAIVLTAMTSSGAFAQSGYDGCPGMPNPTGHGGGMAPSASSCGVPGHYKDRCTPCVPGRPGVCNGYSAQCCSRYEQKCMEGNTR